MPVNSALDLRGLLTDLVETADSSFVVIGSSALAIQGWEVSPGDLDLFARADDVERIEAALRLQGDGSRLVEDGAARRLEYSTEKGRVDVYLEVSGGLSYEDVARDAVTVYLRDGEVGVQVGSLAHVRDMRAAVGRKSLPADAVAPAEKPGTPLVIAIDGPAGAGKSTVTRALARSIGFTYLDTGAMYRCLALAVLSRKVDTDDLTAVGQVAEQARIEFSEGRVLLDGSDVSDQIRSPDVTRVTPHIAAYPEVRASMEKRQRQLFADGGGYVAEGRDTGTVVAPDAPLKIFLTATAEERARRRSEESGEPVESVLEALRERDRMDSERALSALRVAEDAVVVDTTGRSVDDVVGEVASLARDRGIV